MKQHQVLTGSANPGSHCYGVGQIQNFTFWAYGSGCDLVISSSARQPAQIISSENKAHITALDCSETSGNIAVAYSGEVVIFTPKQDGLDYKWIRASNFNLKDNHGTARILSWNYASDQLLIGCEVINLWTLKAATDHVLFQLNEHETSAATKWRCAWSSDLDERPIQLAFSPNSAPCPLFASVAKGECMIKIWYSRLQKNVSWVNTNSANAHDQDTCDFTFTYLMHPQPVIGFEWRKNFVYNESECFSNTLISSCEDQICRVWCETKLPVSRLLRFQSTVQSSLQRKRRKSNQESEHAKRAASAPVMSNLDSTFWNPLHRSCLHQDIRHFHIAASINPLSDIPLLPAFSLPNQVKNCSDECMSSVFTVHWLNNKFHQAQLLVKKGEDKKVDYSQVDMDSSEDFTATSDQLNQSHAPRHFHGTLNQLTQMWRDSRDALYSIHPTDGSLLVWHIDWLDEDRAGKISQPQICFSSRIPLAFSSGDAGTLCPRMILFVNYTTQQNILHSTSYMSFQSQLKPEENLDQTIYSSVQILSKHNDGSLNLWQISFNDEDDFSSISSISHSSRFCGHCFHLSGILSHPLLPLMVTTAGYQLEDQKHRESELILWRVDPIGPLSHTGGLSELARVSCQRKHLFSNVTWFPILLPSWCLGVENNSPSTALVSLSDNKLQVYQIVVDAGKILADVLSPMSTPADSGILQNSLVSQQSSAHPGCLLHLTTLEDEGKKWGKILFLETFPANVMEANTSDTNTSTKFVKSFYIVMLEVSDEGAYLHTWSIVFSGNMSSMKGTRLRRTTVQMLDTTSEEDSSEDEDTDRSQTFPKVDIKVTKMSNQQLVFPVDCSVVSACSWAGRFTLLFASEQEEHLYPAPYHLCTACSDGSIYFWSCSMPKDKSGQCVWNLRQNCEQTMSDTDIDLHGNPIMIKAANPTLLACLCVVNSNKVIVSVYECASSGGAVWKEQGLIEYTSVNLNTLKSKPSFHLDWLSQEDGSFFLVVGVSTNIQIYALTPTDLKDKQNTSCVLSHDDGISPTKRLVKQQSLDMHTRHKLAASKLKLPYQNLSFGDSLSTSDTAMMKLLEWTKLTELDISAPSYGCDLNKPNRHITVSWARDGMLVVASATEMHVFSQWIQEDKTKENSTKEVKLRYKNVDDEVVVGLSELVDKVCPSLPQYHPHVLSELLNSSHLDVVRSILIHLAICMNGDYCDSTCRPETMQVEKFQFSEQLSSLMQTCSSGFHITPLPLHDLLGPDGMIRKKTTDNQDSQAKDSNQGTSSSENALGDFFMETEREEVVDINDELDEILGMQSQKSKSTKYAEKVDLSKLDRDYFGKEHCRVIHEFLIHNQLPGLTSFDQMELMALADTLEMTNASSLKEQQQEEYAETQPSAVGLTAGERGYAVSGGGAGALDNCGLRFVMALHNHLCLLNSLPAPNRAVLLKRGLNTCQFAWAFHSEAEEEILSLLPSVQKGAPDWQELHSMGAGWWIRSTVLLRRLIEQTARAAFLKNNEPLNAALFYLALNKKSVLCGLFRSVKDQRMLKFFQNNFKEDRWRRAALKNAFALMGKQRFQEAAAFFLLAGSVKDAVEICIDKMKDIQLAVVICRLRENADISHHQLLTAHVLNEEGSKKEVSRIPSDCFLRSMAYWILGQYDKSINTLLTDIKFEDITDVFNFYVFLRSHPIVLRNRAQLSGGQAVSSLTSSHHICGPLDVVDEKERKLIFQTAVVHLQSGCPILAIDSLTKLPKVFMSTESNVNQVVRKAEEQIPVLSKVVEDSVDWSQPVVQEDEELELDWSEEECGSESDGDAVPVATTIPQITVENDIPAPIAEEQNDSGLATKHDVFAHHLRMNACFKIFVQELKAIATAYSSDGGLLRSKLYIWLEDASNIFHRVFGLNEFDVEDSLKPKPEFRVEEDCSTDNEDSTSMGSITATASTPAPSLHELLLADNQDWKTRRLGLLRRRKWLQRHHNFLRTLLSYCNLHDSAFGALATMRMELLLLLQESLQDRNSIFSLSSPLPHPSENIPLITSVVAMCKTVVADPLTHLSHMTKDILCSVLCLVSPPHPNTTNGHQNSVILCSQAASLSSCIYQSLCDTSTPSYHSQLLKTDGLQVEFSSNESYRRPSTPNLSTSYLQQMGAPLHPSSYVAPTTAPTQWPGVAVLQSMLNSEASGGESKNKIVTLLCEATASVYISLLVHALQTHNTALMYRLANHKLGSKMWNAVFGGGVKLYVKYSKSRLNVEPGSLTSGNKWRERLTHKLLSNSERKTSISSSSEQSTYREKFVPPETSLWEWLLTKPFVTPSNDEGLGFDSDAESEDSASSVTSFGSDNYFDDESFNAATEEVSQQDDDHSYSWKLMRAGVVQTVLSNIQSFIPLAGFELTELSSSSPLLCASIQLLQQWHAELMAKVDDCGGPPSGFLPSLRNANYVAATSGSPAQRPAMLKYQVMLEPNNTPFEGSGKDCMGCRRLWHSLVKKENLQEMFIKYIFHRKSSEALAAETASLAQEFDDNASVVTAKSIGEFGGKVKILHKETDLLAAFCINNVNSNCIALASAKDIQELDLSVLLASDNWAWVDDITTQTSNPSSFPNDEDFLFVSVPNKTQKGPQIFLPGSHSSVPWSSTSQTGQGANVLMKRQVGGVRRMESHPTLPYYLTGNRDGAICMWEWGHQQMISQYQTAGHYAKVNNLHFSNLGNKISAVGADGYLSMWQVSSGSKPFLHHLCHDRGVNDCCFVSSASVLATAGLSSSNKNVAIWDTLMPKKSILVKDFATHEQTGAYCIRYLPRHRTLLVGGKNGQITVFDDRCLQGPVTKFAAHETSVKCLAVDSSEKFYVTGSANGSVKVWDSLTHKTLYVSNQEHSRSSIFRNFGSGTVQIVTTKDHILTCGADGSLKMKMLPSADYWMS